MINQFKVVVSCVILNQTGQVLLGRRSLQEDVYPGLWGIPGGKVEVEANGLNTIEETLIREVEEEMGVQIKPRDYLESSVRVKGDEAKLYLIFSAVLVSGEPQPLEDTSEVGWFDLKDLSVEDLTPHTYQNIQLALAQSPRPLDQP